MESTFSVGAGATSTSARRPTRFARYGASAGASPRSTIAPPSERVGGIFTTVHSPDDASLCSENVLVTRLQIQRSYGSRHYAFAWDRLLRWRGNYVGIGSLVCPSVTAAERQAMRCDAMRCDAMRCDAIIVLIEFSRKCDREMSCTTSLTMRAGPGCRKDARLRSYDDARSYPHGAVGAFAKSVIGDTSIAR